MIVIYCRSKHGSGKELCAECGSLGKYALQRLESCTFGEEKPSCATCPIHCYKSSMRIKIKEVMRFAAPRMLFLHPVDTFRHFYQEHRRNRKYAAKSKAKQKR